MSVGNRGDGDRNRERFQKSNSVQGTTSSKETSCEETIGATVARLTSENDGRGLRHNCGDSPRYVYEKQKQKPDYIPPG